METDLKYLEKACEAAMDGMRSNKGGPFGAVVVLNGRVIGIGCNEVLSSNNPIAHAEINAIQAACKSIHNFHLAGATLYCSCEPCPMCLAAVYWARIGKVIFASHKEDAALAGFDDLVIHQELGLDTRPISLKMEFITHPLAKKLFKEWMDKKDKVIY
ncbi:MAG: nucleoside deaminase [Bacteroidia bacterium]